MDRSPVTGSFLSFLWPGLGHLYLGRRLLALIWAVVPAVLVVGLLALIVSGPSTFALNLLGPTFSLVIIGVLALHGIWRVAAILDSWRLTRASPRALTDRTLPVAVMLSVLVLVAHVGAATFVQSFSDAGQRIFTSDRPTGPDQIDDILGGGTVSTDPAATDDPNPAIDVNGDGVIDSRDDINGDGLINADDIDAGDINGDGVVDENDLLTGDTNGDGVVDGNDLPDGEENPDEVVPGDTNGDGVVDGNDQPGATPGPTFDPGASPPPIAIDPGDVPGGSLPSDGPINVLFVGLDSGLGRTHSLSDSLIVASYYPSRDTVTMISFPRDLGRIPLYKGGVYPARINTFLGYAGRHPELFPEGPIVALMRELGFILGINIHYYAATNLDGLPSAVDAVGGVDVLVDRPIADPRWGLYLEPGQYHLNGVTVMPFVRSRYGENNDDWKRARRQQQVILALAARVKDPSVALRLPEVISALSEVVRTNVPREQAQMLLSIVEKANEASAEQIVLSPPGGYAQRIPAIEVHGRYMIEPNIAAIRELSIRVFGSYSRYH